MPIFDKRELCQRSLARNGYIFGGQIFFYGAFLDALQNLLKNLNLELNLNLNLIHFCHKMLIKPQMLT